MAASKTNKKSGGSRKAASKGPSRVELDIIELEQEADKGDDLGEGAEALMTTNGLQQYLTDIKNYAPRLLTKEEELWLGSRIREHEDKDAAETLILFNTRLVVKMAVAYYKKNPVVPLLDVIQNGNIGLTTAAQRYDHKKGFRFATYATWWIRMAIYRYSNNQRNIVRYPVGMYDKITKLNKAMAKYESEHNEEPGLKELSKLSGISEKDIIEIWRIKEGPIFLDEKFDEEDGEGTMSDVLLVADDQTAKVNLMEDMGILKKKLTAKEYELIYMHYGLHGSREYTAHEIAKMLNVSANTISTKLRGIMEKLKDDADMIELASYIS